MKRIIIEKILNIIIALTLITLAVLIIKSSVGAQLPTAPPISVANIVAVNLTPHMRHDISTTVLPFSKGVYHGEPLSIRGQRLQVTRLGASWPDSSWRYARVNYPVDIGPNGVEKLSVTTGAGISKPFEWAESLVRGVPNLGLGFKIGNNFTGFAPWSVLEDGHLIKVWRSRIRIPNTTFWAELTIEAGSELDYIKWWLWYGDSDSREPNLEHNVGEILLQTQGVHVVVRHKESKVLAGNANSIKLMHPEKWADGESQALHGIFIFPPLPNGDWSTLAAEQILPVLSVSDSWKESGAYGPWGFIPNLPNNFDRNEARRRAVIEWGKYKRGDPWEEGLHGSSKNPNKTGGQPDFGAAKLIEAAQGYPEILYVVQRASYQEACRPIWLRNKDIEPLDYLAQIPLPHVWGGVFWRTTPNLLGKNKPPGGYPPKVHNFFPRDRQHETVLWWTSYAMLTGDRLALDMLDAYTDIWLAREVTNSGNPTIDGLPAPRGIGRTMDTGIRLYLLNARPDLASSIRNRISHTANLFAGANTSPMRPLGVGKPDPRKFRNLPIEQRMELSPVTGWQEGLGLRGLDAVHIILDSSLAGDLCYWVGTTLLDDMMWKDSKSETNHWVISDAVAWKGGRHLTELEINAGQREAAGGGSLGWVDWVFAGVIATRRQAIARNDKQLELKCDKVIAQQLALGFNWDGWRWVR